MLKELLAEMVFVAKTEIIRDLLDTDFFKSVKIGHRLFDFKIKHILVYGLSKGSLEFAFRSFYGYVHHICEFFISEKAFGVVVYHALDFLRTHLRKGLITKLSDTFS